jgi:Holliday junction resolvase-like predicted endonuclease
MSVDFFKTICQITTSEKIFGLYDSEDKTPAKIKLTDESTWNATVINNEGKTVRFTAIDNCIDVFRENGEMDSRCDCMITYNSTLLFVELKNKRESWQTEGLAQIENIAKIMIDELPNHYFSFKKRKAIVANRKHQFPAFQNSNAEQRQYFSSKYKMRIHFEAEIKLD